MNPVHWLIVGNDIPSAGHPPVYTTYLALWSSIGLDGVTALLAMLASCAAGVTVVGIDNGFGAACAVARLLGARAAHA